MASVRRAHLLTLVLVASLAAPIAPSIANAGFCTRALHRVLSRAQEATEGVPLFGRAVGTRTEAAINALDARAVTGVRDLLVTASGGIVAPAELAAIEAGLRDLPFAKLEALQAVLTANEKFLPRIRSENAGKVVQALRTFAETGGTPRLLRELNQDVRHSRILAPLRVQLGRMAGEASPELSAALDQLALDRLDGALESLEKSAMRLAASGARIELGNLGVGKRALQEADAAGAGPALEFHYELLARPQDYRRFSAQVKRAAYARYREALDPYTTGFDLGEAAIRSVSLREFRGVDHARLNELLEFEALKASPKGLGRWLHDGEKWVKSEDHALYLYQHLEEFPPARANPLFERLLAQNEYFKRVGRVRGPPRTLVTYAFEKESQKGMITLMYRPAAIDEATWANMTEEARIEKFKQAIGAKDKSFMPADVIAPTSLRPSSVGGFSQEWRLGEGDYTMEVAHKSYEVSRARVKREVRGVAEALGETHSIHEHVVFDMAENDPHFEDFVTWFKQGNDYLYLKGMEEGLHGTGMTQLAELPTERVSLGQFVDHHVPLRTSRSLPKNLDSVNERRFKFYSLGLRRGRYGKSKAEGYTKVGLELRDTTRKLDTMDENLDTIGESVEKRVWEIREPLRRDDLSLIFLKPATAKDVPRLVALGFEPEIARTLIEAEPTLLLALERYENARFFNYRTQAFRYAEPEVGREIRAARESFVSELLKIQTEIQGYRARKEPLESGDIQMAVRMCLSDWAKQARVSRLYSGI